MYRLGLEGKLKNRIGIKDDLKILPYVLLLLGHLLL